MVHTTAPLMYFLFLSVFRFKTLELGRIFFLDSVRMFESQKLFKKKNLINLLTIRSLFLGLFQTERIFFPARKHNLCFSRMPWMKQAYRMH